VISGVALTCNSVSWPPEPRNPIGPTAIFLQCFWIFSFHSSGFPDLRDPQQKGSPPLETMISEFPKPRLQRDLWLQGFDPQGFSLIWRHS
jgi:hypothetical protein